MKYNKRKMYQKIQLRFIPYENGTWIMQYRIDPSELPIWRRLVNIWIAPKPRYIGILNDYENPLEAWKPILISSELDAQYWRERLRIYKDLYEYAHSYDNQFREDVNKHYRFIEEHQMQL